jgi:acyl-CoA oxidase
MLNKPLYLSGHLAFIPVLNAQGSDEQVEKWVPLAENYQIIGCYAQTELGHGSNLSGLETTATFIRESDEWEINSTTFTAAKWWIGGLGVICTHAVVQAKLIIDGKDYGAHVFIVPIRSLEDHKPFPGVEVGDIGPKAYGGFGKMDNGCKFHFYYLPNSRTRNTTGV